MAGNSVCSRMAGDAHQLSGRFAWKAILSALSSVGCVLYTVELQQSVAEVLCHPLLSGTWKLAGVLSVVLHIVLYCTVVLYVVLIVVLCWLCTVQLSYNSVLLMSCAGLWWLEPGNCNYQLSVLYNRSLLGPYKLENYIGPVPTLCGRPSVLLPFFELIIGTSITSAL